MNSRTTNLIIIALVLISFSAGAYFYPQMPEKMASHWNFKGEVDGYLSKFWALFLMPIISLGLFFLYLLIPKIDPLKENIEKFRKYFDRFIILILLFLFYLYFLTIFWNLGARFNIEKVLAPAFAVLFYYCGVLVEHAERNWFIGIRTPWTLSSDEVWEKTHKAGGKLFKFAGLIIFLGMLLEGKALLFVLIPIFTIIVYLILYSYFEYQRSKN